nr:hypothetical protein [Candidatus Sigynarchaeota archaeon]
MGMITLAYDSKHVLVAEDNEHGGDFEDLINGGTFHAEDVTRGRIIFDEIIDFYPEVCKDLGFPNFFPSESSINTAGQLDIVIGKIKEKTIAFINRELPEPTRDSYEEMRHLSAIAGIAINFLKACSEWAKEKGTYIHFSIG